MRRRRLSNAQVAEYVGRYPADVSDVVIELRDLVLRVAPAVEEAVRFHALCYFKAGQPFGAIGGNVCLISPRADCVRLEFIHGSSLADPARLLRGSAKAKRYVELRPGDELRRVPIRNLIRAALAYSPADTEGRLSDRTRNHHLAK